MDNLDIEVLLLLYRYLDENFPLNDFESKVQVGIYRDTDCGKKTYEADQISRRQQVTPHFLAGIHAAFNLKHAPHCAKTIVNDSELLNKATEGEVVISKEEYEALLKDRQELRDIEAVKLLSRKMF